MACQNSILPNFFFFFNFKLNVSLKFFFLIFNTSLVSRDVCFGKSWRNLIALSLGNTFHLFCATFYLFEHELKHSLGYLEHSMYNLSFESIKTSRQLCCFHQFMWSSYDISLCETYSLIWYWALAWLPKCGSLPKLPNLCYSSFWSRLYRLKKCS